METRQFICDCHSLEHHVIFWYDDEDKLFYIEVYLITHRNFLKRLLIGLKYAFGYKSKYGNWDSFIFKEVDEKKLRYFLNKKRK